LGYRGLLQWVAAQRRLKTTDLNIPQIKTIPNFTTTSNPFQPEVCQTTKAQKKS